MKNKEFCPSDMISLLEGAFDSDNGNLMIKMTAKKLVELSDAGAKFYGKIAVVPSENGKYRLVDASIADLLELEGISITLDSNDRESVENALLNKIVQLEGQANTLRYLCRESLGFEPFDWKKPAK